MENFNKPTIHAEGLSKVIKLLALVAGMGVAGNSFSQEKVVNIEQLIKDAKKLEMAISEKVAKSGTKGTLNTVLPYSEIHDSNSISQVMYKDNQRTEEASVLMGKSNFYFFDKDADGKVDAVYIDKNEKPLNIEEGSMKALISMAGEISQTELDLSSMDGMQKFVCFKLKGENDSKVYSTEDQKIYGVAPADEKNMEETLQKKFNEVLQSNFESMNK